MILDNEGPDESEFFSPDDVPTSEGQSEDNPNDNEDEPEDLLDGDDADPDQEGEGTDDDLEAPENDEFEEMEIEGKTVKVPKDLKPLLLTRQDYTRKTMELAEFRKAQDNEIAQAREQARAEIAQQAETVKQFTREIAQLHSIDERLEQYEQVDWQAWRDQNFMEANAGFQEYQLLKDKRAQTAHALGQKQSQARHAQEQRSREAHQAEEAELEKRHGETLAVVKAQVPGWNEEVAGKVSGFALSQGYTRDELVRAAADPRAMLLLHKAWRGEQLEAQQKAAAKKAKADIQPQGRPLTPVAKGRSAPATAGLDDRLSADEWARRRNEQLRSRGR